MGISTVHDDGLERRLRHDLRQLFMNFLVLVILDHHGMAHRTRVQRNRLSARPPQPVRPPLNILKRAWCTTKMDEGELESDDDTFFGGWDDWAPPVELTMKLADDPEQPALWSRPATDAPRLAHSLRRRRTPKRASSFS